MDFNKQRLSVEKARQIDMVNYLFNLGYAPAKIRGNNYWYLSPLRNEKTASFKVDRKLNRWYDHGIGKGGNIIDFAILHTNCTVGEFLHQMSGDFSLQQPVRQAVEKHVADKAESKITILQERAISSFLLLRYLQQRRVPVSLAERYCRQVHYLLNEKEYFGIGFKNNSNGYEIRNPFFKISSAPKDITTFNNGAQEAAVFEGFTDFLSYLAIRQNQSQQPTDFVVLNSVSFFEKARPFMEKHDCIRLYLDRDTTGQNCSQYALSVSRKYKDESGLYRHYNDLNEWLVQFGKSPKKNLRMKF